MHDNGDPSGSHALSLIPTGRYVMTAAFEAKRAGAIVNWVQPCSEEPVLICVAARKGHTVEPLIRDSHAFGLCMIREDDRLLARKFEGHIPPDELGDPFDSLEVESMMTGSPLIKRSLVAFDCEVVRHFDLEADHELYVGQVVGTCIYDR